MGGQRQDGSILSSALTGSRHRKAVELDHGMYRCMVTRVLYTDDEGNLTFDNKQVTYEVIILGGRKEGQNIVNVKAASLLGGEYNYHERIYRASEFKFSGPTKKPLGEHNGDIVYVQYINGNTSLPVIVGAGVSPLDKDSTGATKADGHIFRQQYNGIKESIDRDGNLVTQRFGGEWNEEAGYFKPSEEALITETWSEEKTVRTFKNGLTIEADGALDKMIRTYKSGMKIEEDGQSEKISFSLPSGTIITADGKAGKITIDADGGNNQIIIDKGGEMTIKASSKVKVEAPLVDVGEGAAFSSTLFENLLSEFAKHTHNVPQSPGGVNPSTPPVAPLISLVGSQSVKVKD